MKTLSRLSLIVISASFLSSSVVAVPIHHTHILGAKQLGIAASLAVAVLPLGSFTVAMGLPAISWQTDKSTEGIRDGMAIMAVISGIATIGSAVGSVYFAKKGFKNLMPLFREIMKERKQ